MNDSVLEQFESRWPEATPKEKAQILAGLIMYVKRKYDVQNFKRSIDSKTKELEAIVTTLELKEFLVVSRAIGYARKQIAELGNTYGSGLKRKPKGAELKDARSFRPVNLRNGSGALEEDDPDPDSDDEF